MRTTLNVDDDVLEFAKDVAYIRQISVGEALSMMARQGMSPALPMRLDPETGLTMIDPPANAPIVTSEMVERAQELEDLEYAKFFRKP